MEVSALLLPLRDVNEEMRFVKFTVRVRLSHKLDVCFYYITTLASRTSINAHNHLDYDGTPCED